MDLFDVVKMLFDRNSKWTELKTYDKGRNFFMINRFMSINYPMQANMFNTRQIQSSSAVDSWKDVMNRLFTKTPPWIYTKTKKTETKGKKKHPEKETVQEWMRLNKMSKKDLDSMMELHHDETMKEIFDFEKILKEKNNG